MSTPSTRSSTSVAPAVTTHQYSDLLLTLSTAVEQLGTILGAGQQNPLTAQFLEKSYFPFPNLTPACRTTALKAAEVARSLLEPLPIIPSLGTGQQATGIVQSSSLYSQAGSNAKIIQDRYDVGFTTLVNLMTRLLSGLSPNDLSLPIILTIAGALRQKLAKENNSPEALAFGLWRTGALDTPLNLPLYRRYRPIIQRIAENGPLATLPLKSGSLQAHMVTLGLSQLSWATTPDLFLDEIAVITHANPTSIQEHMPEVEKMVRQLLASRRTMQPPEIIRSIAGIHWLFSQITPFKRGSAAIVEAFVIALFQACGLSLPRLSGLPSESAHRGLVLSDLEAITRSRKEFEDYYPELLALLNNTEYFHRSRTLEGISPIMERLRAISESAEPTEPLILIDLLKQLLENFRAIPLEDSAAKSHVAKTGILLLGTLYDKTRGERLFGARTSAIFFAIHEISAAIKEEVQNAIRMKINALPDKETRVQTALAYNRIKTAASKTGISAYVHIFARNLQTQAKSELRNFIQTFAQSPTSKNLVEVFRAKIRIRTIGEAIAVAEQELQDKTVQTLPLLDKDLRNLLQLDQYVRCAYEFHREAIEKTPEKPYLAAISSEDDETARFTEIASAIEWNRFLSVFRAVGDSELAKLQPKFETHLASLNLKAEEFSAILDEFKSARPGTSA